LALNRFEDAETPTPLRLRNAPPLVRSAIRTDHIERSSVRRASRSSGLVNVAYAARSVPDEGSSAEQMMTGIGAMSG
jgi:hypothetical protein